MFDLEGKKALITGASGGIGKEIAKVLIEHNAEVCISGRNHEELNALKKSLGKKMRKDIFADVLEMFFKN